MQIFASDTNERVCNAWVQHDGICETMGGELLESFDKSCYATYQCEALVFGMAMETICRAYDKRDFVNKCDKLNQLLTVKCNNFKRKW